MKKLLFICLSVFLFGEYVMGQNADMSDSDYYNSALYLLTKKGDISKGQMYMDLAFQKGFGNTTPIVEIIQINYNAVFDNRDKIGNPNHFYVPLFMCSGALNYCTLTQNEKELLYAIRGASKLQIAISKRMEDPLSYYNCMGDLQMGGEEGRKIIEEFNAITQKQQNRQKAPQGKRLKKDPNFKIE